MQYVEYGYACISPALLKWNIESWLKRVKHLSWETRSRVLTDWRNNRVLLAIGEPPVIDDPAHSLKHFKKEFHKKAYTQKYLERNLFKL
jgi:hypothetical protein